MGDDVKFCPGCGASVGDTQTNEQMVTATPVSTITARSFRCNGCGESLKIPQNARGVMKCPSCKTECVLDGLIKNEEMAAKENINSGVPLTATASILHRQLISILSKSTNIPLDVFDNVEVVREERYCVPAYCFEYNGDAPFSYEEGKQETRQERGFSGGKETITTIKEVKWHTERGNASVSGTLFVSGNKKTTPYINQMYKKTDHNQLVDFEYLEFPPDVETLEYDLPQLTVFNEHIKPVVDNLLTKEGEKALDGTNYEGYIPRGGQYGVRYTRDFKLSGSKIQKEITRVFLGLYRIVYKYGDQEFSMWVCGDGKKVISDGLPENLYSSERKKLSDTLDEKKQLFSSIPGNKTGFLIFGFIACIAAVAFSIYSIIANGFGIPFLIIGLISAAGAGLCGKFFSSVRKKGKEQDAQRADARIEIDNAQKAIDDFEAQLPNIIRRFMEQKKALRGIYEKLSGNTEAFQANGSSNDDDVD
jgi:ribosomal protein L37AE/L43A